MFSSNEQRKGKRKNYSGNVTARRIHRQTKLYYYIMSKSGRYCTVEQHVLKVDVVLLLSETTEQTKIKERTILLGDPAVQSQLQDVFWYVNILSEKVPDRRLRHFTNWECFKC